MKIIESTVSEAAGHAIWMEILAKLEKLRGKSICDRRFI